MFSFLFADSDSPDRTTNLLVEFILLTIATHFGIASAASLNRQSKHEVAHIINAQNAAMITVNGA